MPHAQISPSRYRNNIDKSRAAKVAPEGGDLDTNPLLAAMFQSQKLMADFLVQEGYSAAKVNVMNVNDMQYAVSLLVEAGVDFPLPNATTGAADPVAAGTSVMQVYVNTTSKDVFQWDGNSWQKVYDSP